MKAQELRIGNLVLHNTNICVVRELSISGITLIGIPMNSEIDYKDAEPIPLAEEWLLKFEHTHTHSNKYQKFTEGYIFQIIVVEKREGKRWLVSVVSNTNGELLTVPIKYIDYVHEYENLFFELTGQELTMKE